MMRNHSFQIKDDLFLNCNFYPISTNSVVTRKLKHDRLIIKTNANNQTSKVHCNDLINKIIKGERS